MEFVSDFGFRASDLHQKTRIIGHGDLENKLYYEKVSSMSYIMVDVEADGPIPGDYSMVCFGAIVVEPELSQTFYGRLKPISEAWIPEALAVSEFSREETLAFDDPQSVMEQFADWLREHSRDQPLFISDNNGFDWQFINWYFHHFLGENPFGFSSTNLGSLYKGIVRDAFKSFKHLRKTAHTHHPVDDVRGNAEALLAIKNKYGLKIRLRVISSVRIAAAVSGRHPAARG